MRGLVVNFRVCFRILTAMFLFFVLTEAVGFFIFGVRLRYSHFLAACGLAGVIAAGMALLAAGVCSLIRTLEPFRARLASFVGALGLLYLFLVLWVDLFFRGKPWWLHGLGFMALLALLALFGYFVWSYLSRSDAVMADAWFQALAPVSAFCAGLYSTAEHRVEQPAFRALSILGIFALLAVGQYLTVRFIWSRKRRALTRWSLRAHAGVIISVPLLATAGVLLEYKREHRPASAPPDSPPVILLMVDTLRRDHLSAYNPAFPATPAFDSLARDGIRFENAVSPSSWTPPAVGAMITGLYPAACNAGSLVSSGDGYYNYSGPLFAAKTLGEAFQEAGYTTALFSANPWIIPGQGYDGFDHFELFNDPLYWPRFRFLMGLDLLITPVKSPRSGNARGLNDQVIAWLKRRPAGPFFLWVHYIDPHLPYYAHREFPTETRGGPMAGRFARDQQSWRIRAGSYNLDDNDRQFLRERYAGEVRFTDLEIGRLLAVLKEEGVYEKSVIMLTSDHGEELWDHGDFEHGHCFYNEVIAVPLIVKLPGKEAAGEVISRWVSTLNIGATLLDAAGLKIKFPGTSLLACRTDPACGDSSLFGRVFLSERTHYGTDRGALVTVEGYKAYFHSNGRIACYDLNSDPGEKNPLPEETCLWPEDLPRPGELFNRFAEENHRIFLSLGGDKEPPQRATMEELRRLRDLGYIK